MKRLCLVALVLLFVILSVFVVMSNETEATVVHQVFMPLIQDDCPGHYVYYPDCAWCIPERPYCVGWKE